LTFQQKKKHSLSLLLHPLNKFVTKKKINEKNHHFQLDMLVSRIWTKLWSNLVIYKFYSITFTPHLTGHTHFTGVRVMRADIINLDLKSIKLSFMFSINTLKKLANKNMGKYYIFPRERLMNEWMDEGEWASEREECEN
jgi:hypothetical protein